MLIMLFQSCTQIMVDPAADPASWTARTVQNEPTDSLIKGSTYLSVATRVYSQTEHTTHSLTATVSMRNVSKVDTLYVDQAEFFNTKGKSIRTYLQKPIFVAPLETLETVIHEQDQEGGTGANFLFDWRIKPGTNEPLFEGIMISTSGQQGLSFTTQGRRIY